MVYISDLLYMDYWKVEGGIFILLLGVLSAGGVKCYLHRAANDTEESLGHWMYCVTGCCHDHCCDDKPAYNTDATETMAMIFVGLFALGSLCIIISWTKIGKASRHLCQKRQAEDLAPLASTEESLPPRRDPPFLTKAIHCVLYRKAPHREGIPQDKDGNIQRPPRPLDPIPLPFPPQFPPINRRMNETSSTYMDSTTVFKITDV